MSAYLVTYWQILTVLRAATDFLTQTFIYVAVFLVWAISAVIPIVTKTTAGDAPAIFAHKKWTVAWMFWKKKIKHMEYKRHAFVCHCSRKHSQIWQLVCKITMSKCAYKMLHRLVTGLMNNAKEAKGKQSAPGLQLLKTSLSYEISIQRSIYSNINVFYLIYTVNNEFKGVKMTWHFPQAIDLWEIICH